MVSTKLTHYPCSPPKLGGVADFPLSRTDLGSDPLEQFRVWFDVAQNESLPLPEAMALATASDEGAPSARIVLLKVVDHGFVFFTNYGSHKGRDLAANPQAALVFHWQPLGRQVRVEGSVERISQAESEAYFETRPRGAQLGAWASPQSQAIRNRAELEKRLGKIAADHGAGPVPRPPVWGGFRPLPARVEFWQHRDDRLHDRFLYERDGDDWRITRLAP